jgi:hypothetical protein
LYPNQNNHGDNIIILIFYADQLLCDLQTDFIFADRNATTDDCQFYFDFEGLCQIDWEQVKMKFWTQYGIQYKETMHKMQAETCVLKRVGMEHLASICCLTNRAKEEVGKITRQFKGRNFNVEIAQNLYFP